MIWIAYIIWIVVWLMNTTTIRRQRRTIAKLAARANYAETRADNAEYVAREVARVHRETATCAMELERVAAVRRGDVVGVN